MSSQKIEIFVKYLSFQTRVRNQRMHEKKLKIKFQQHVLWFKILKIPHLFLTIHLRHKCLDNVFFIQVTLNFGFRTPK